MAEAALRAAESEIQRLVIGILPSDNSVPIRRVLLPTRELSRRGLAQGLAVRMDGEFPRSLGEFPRGTILYCPAFLSILSWLDVAQALGLKVIYDVTYNPFLIPCNDPRYMLWGDQGPFMQAYVEALGLPYDPTQLLAESESRRWELRTTLGRTDQITAPTSALSEQFHADLVPDYVCEEEFEIPTESEKDRMDLAWRGEGWELVGLRQIWEPTLEVLQDHPSVRFSCYGPLSDWFLRKARAAEVEFQWSPDPDPISFNADLFFVVHPKGLFYEGLSTIEVMRSVWACRGRTSLLGTGPIAERFAEIHGGLVVELEDWRNALEILIEDQKLRTEQRPVLPANYREAEGLEVLLA